MISFFPFGKSGWLTTLSRCKSASLIPPPIMKPVPQKVIVPEVVISVPFKDFKWEIKNFSLMELTKTENREFLDQNRNFTQEQADKLAKLIKTCVYPVREKWGPITVKSAYRCKDLNVAIKGSKDSQHCKFEAIDFEVFGRREGEKLYEVFKWIWKESKIPFGQLIWELNEWIHISLGEPYRMKSDCGQVLVYKKDSKGNGKYERIA